MRVINWSEVPEAAEDRLVANGYICKITAVEDIPEKEYLRLEYDIAEGPFAGYYQNLYQRANFWGGNVIRSYKESARSFFKSFLTAIQESNHGYQFQNDEKTLVGKWIGFVLREEYRKNNGDIGTRLVVDQTRSIDKIKAGDFEVRPKKRIEQTPNSSTYSGGFQPLSDADDDLPF